MKARLKTLGCSFFLLLTSWSQPVLAGWFSDTLVDPQDGMLDASDYLASAKGFLPVPIFITEPAVGYGFGMAVAYFHAPKEMDKEEHPHSGPPSISVVFGAKTENDTYFYGGAHSGVWKDDHIRYIGALAKMNINTTFFPGGLIGEIVGPEGVGFNIDGALLFQQLKFRLKESNWWLGGNYVYVNADNTFDLNLPVDWPKPVFDFALGGVSAFVEYDGTDSTFTPTRGLSGKLKFENYDDIWGSDFNYNRYTGELYKFTPVGKYSSLGLRLEAETVSGEVPFFAYPFVDLRGIPALRYQGQDTAVFEAEYLWGITPRWSVVFFGGIGLTTPVSELDSEGETVAAGGLGFRYRLARKLGLQAGVDVARGPEDTAVYLVVGSAW